MKQKKGVGVGVRKKECKLRKELHRSGSERKGQEDEKKSLERYGEDDQKQMLAAVRGEAAGRECGSGGYLSLKDRDTKIKCLSVSKEKDQKGYFLSTFEVKLSMCGPQSSFFTKWLILISTKKGCFRAVRKFMHIVRTE